MLMNCLSLLMDASVCWLIRKIQQYDLYKNKNQKHAADVSSVVYQCLLLMVSLKLKRYAETAIVMILQM